MGYKYLTVVNEDTIATEKYTNGNLTSAEAYKDFISTDVAEGNMNVPELYEKSDPSLLSGGKIVEKDKIYFEPEINFTTGLAGLCFLCQSLGDSIFDSDDATSISEMESGDKLYISLNSEKEKARGEWVRTDDGSYPVDCLDSLEYAIQPYKGKLIR